MKSHLIWLMIVSTLMLNGNALAQGERMAQGMFASKLPALVPAVEELKNELELTDQQTSEAQTLVVGLLGHATKAVDEFGGVSFESILDLLVEVRGVREEYIPALRNLLTEDQKAKLAKLPKAHEIYVSAMSGWLAEAQLGKLSERVGLTEEQIPQARSILLKQFQEAVPIVEGLIQKEEGESLKESILDAVLDLRLTQRQAQRKLNRMMTDEQRTRLESFRKESDEKSREKDMK